MHSESLDDLRYCLRKCKTSTLEQLHAGVMMNKPILHNASYLTIRDENCGCLVTQPVIDKVVNSQDGAYLRVAENVYQDHAVEDVAFAYDEWVTDSIDWYSGEADITKNPEQFVLPTIQHLELQVLLTELVAERVGDNSED